MQKNIIFLITILFLFLILSNINAQEEINDTANSNETETNQESLQNVEQETTTSQEQETTTTQEQKTTTAQESTDAQEPAEPAPPKKEQLIITKETIKKRMPFYFDTLKQLTNEAQKNIKKSEKLADVKQENEELARQYLEKADILYKEGKFQEAIQEYSKVLGITKNPAIKK